MRLFLSQLLLPMYVKLARQAQTHYAAVSSQAAVGAALREASARTRYAESQVKMMPEMSPEP